MSKYYVRDYYKRGSDGEKLQIVRVYEAQPKRFDYLIFTKK